MGTAELGVQPEYGNCLYTQSFLREHHTLLWHYESYEKSYERTSYLLHDSEVLAIMPASTRLAFDAVDRVRMPVEGRSFLFLLIVGGGLRE